jgi:hypothetical protein
MENRLREIVNQIKRATRPTTIHEEEEEETLGEVAWRLEWWALQLLPSKNPLIILPFPQCSSVPPPPPLPKSKKPRAPPSSLSPISSSSSDEGRHQYG